MLKQKDKKLDISKLMFILAGILFSFFLFLILLLKTVDVEMVILTGTEIGLASLNKSIFEMFGINKYKPFSKYNGMQKCLLEYNGLIKDSFFREQLRDFRKKLIFFKS